MVKKTAPTEELIVEATQESKSLAKTISDSAVSACTAASNAFPAAGKALRKTVYTGFYYATYGVVFSSLVIASLVPTDNAMGEGIHDGANAAKKDFATRKDEVITGAERATAAA